ncbi:MAG: carbon starvation protein A [Egibacteraceae bacterium]
MPSAVIVIVSFIAFGLGYRYYSKYLAERVYRLEEDFRTPSYEFRDGVDFVPTNKHVLFGHHFTSIAGAAPIVGPAIAVVWGWLPALVWIVLGTIFASGAHDFGSIVISVRHRARNIGTIAQDVISNRARTLFLLIIFFLLTLVVAVFAIVISNLFMANPEVVIPVLAQIPIAIGLGQVIYRRRTAALLPSLIAVVVLYATLPLGEAIPLDITPLAEATGIGFFANEPANLWVVLLFLYSGVASRIPVWVLLQPRDYINSHQLLIALAVIFLGVLVGFDTMEAPAVNTDMPDDAPWVFPFLFVTIACGAISGFHSLVSSGTTSKQLAKETDARWVGYMGSLGEGSLALGAVMAVTAGLAVAGVDWNEAYGTFQAADAGAVGNFVTGVGGLASNIGVPLGLGAVFASLIVIAFAATTLDTGLRLERYVVQEIAEIAGARRVARNLNLVTVVATAIPLSLALFRELAFERLWILFGTMNQLTAGLALSVIAVWLISKRRNALAAIIPLAFLLAMTIFALLLNSWDFLTEGDVFTQTILLPLNLIILGLAVWVVIEAVTALRRLRLARAREDEPVAGMPASDE